MDPFILTIWYLVISVIVLIFKGGFGYGLLFSEIFLIYCLWNYDDCALPLGAVLVYLIIWLIIVSMSSSFLAALIILLVYCLLFVLPVVLWFHFH